MIATHALTVRQPWASLIVAGAKTVENRTWLPGSDPDGPRRIAIHAAQQPDPSAPSWAWGALAFAEPELPWRTTHTYGHVLGLVTYDGAHRDAYGCGCGQWGHDGCWHWQLTGPTPLPIPFAAAGRLGLWPLVAAETSS